MSRTRVYIKPFDDTGVYLNDYIEVTDDVNESSFSSIKRELDSTEYNAGVFKFSNLSLKLANETGRYSDVDVFQSIFRFKRTDSQVKITWSPNKGELPIAGQHVLEGTEDIVIFEGLLSDEASKMGLRDQNVSFKCLGFESLFNRMAVPFSSLTPGDTFDEIILACLNQAPFNTLGTVSGANINTDTNAITDAVASLENKTVKEALDELLVMANSVLFIENSTVKVGPRTPTVSVQYTFFGQASDLGVENISDIKDYRNGLNRVKNYWTWDGVSNLSQDATSISSFGVRKQEVSSELITNSTKIDTILTALKDEFFDKKIEMMLTTPLNYSRLELSLLDRVNIDYPTILISGDGEPLPIWGQSVWGTFVWPIGVWSLTLSTSTNFKIMGISHNIRNGTITYKLREI